jgi:beta-lactamase class D
MKKQILLLILTISIPPGFSQKVIEMNLKSNFDKYGVNGCFVLYNQNENEYIQYNSSLCDSGYIPASTFKIPNALIALEEGIIRDTNQIIKWDGHEWPIKTWNQDQTLKTAMKYSCVWFFSKIAEKIDVNTYYRYIKEFDYGNKNLTGQPNRFWLAGLLRISANQQIEFLKKFYDYKLPISKQNVDIVKDIIVLEKSDAHKLSGKTGGAMINDSRYIMWLVGCIEKDSKPYFYALNFISDDFDKTNPARIEITKSILRQLGLIE